MTADAAKPRGHVNHAQAAGALNTFAFNKIDRPEAPADDPLSNHLRHEYSLRKSGGKYQNPRWP